MIAFAASWYLRRRLGARVWRYAHRFTPVVFALSTVHALTAGSDAGTWWLTLVVFALCAAGAALLALRWTTTPARPRPARAASAPEPAAARPTPSPEPASLWA